MALKVDAHSPSTSLQSKDHGEILDVIDLLRRQGISHHVPLPQLIVCGDQSAGKSSVLEAVSGVRFPTKDTLCTRFATELILRRGVTENVTIGITPGAGRTAEDKEILLGFKAPAVHIDEFPSLVESAKAAMGLNTNVSAFTDDVLRVEVTGPGQPHLTLVDLPGLFHSESKQQSVQDAQLVTSIVRSYMANRRSIILAVVSAKNDYANQIVTNFAREVDPKGLRTLGIITKPDTLPEGSESEQSFFTVAKNEDVVFRLGWHVLRNRDFTTKDLSVAERDQLEKRFFARGIWTALPASSLGISALKPRLSSILTSQIMSELPSLRSDILDGIDECKKRLQKLGEPRGALPEQRMYLLHISQAFSSLVKDAIDGVYTNEFFGDAMTPLGYSKRLRAVIQNILSDFSEDMRREGHAQEIVEERPENSTDGPKRILRSEYIGVVRELMKRSRGCELPGTFNPLIVGELFFQQARPWQALAGRYSERILRASSLTLEHILAHTTDESTREGLHRHIIGPAMETYRQELEKKVAEIMRPYQKGHPITYNCFFTDTIQNARIEHFTEDQLNEAATFFGSKQGISYVSSPRPFSIADLIKKLNKSTNADMDQFACSEAVYCMQAYYEVALKVLVDNFAVLAVECSLVSRLPRIFGLDTVMALNDSLTSQIAAETEDSQLERERATTKLSSLKAGLHILNRLGQNSTAKEGGDGSLTPPLEDYYRIGQRWRGERMTDDPSPSDLGKPVDDTTEPESVPSVTDEAPSAPRAVLSEELSEEGPALVAVPEEPRPVPYASFRDSFNTLDTPFGSKARLKKKNLS